MSHPPEFVDLSDSLNALPPRPDPAAIRAEAALADMAAEPDSGYRVVRAAFGEAIIPATESSPTGQDTGAVDAWGDEPTESWRGSLQPDQLSKQAVQAEADDSLSAPSLRQAPGRNASRTGGRSGASKAGAITAGTAAAAISLAACGGGSTPPLAPLRAHTEQPVTQRSTSALTETEPPRSTDTESPAAALTPAQQVTAKIKPDAEKIAAQAIRGSSGPNAEYAVHWVGSHEAELTAATPAYTTGSDGGYPLDGDPWDESLGDPTPQETQEFNQMVTGLQGTVTVEVRTESADDVRVGDAGNVIGVTVETENMGSNFPNDGNPPVVEYDLESPKGQAEELAQADIPESSQAPGWDVSFSRQTGTNPTQAATSDPGSPQNPDGYGYLKGEGPVETAQMLTEDTLKAVADLGRHIDTAKQREDIASDTTFYG